jgi:Protein kinase domain
MSETERFEIVRSLGRDSGAFVARDRELRRLVVLERVKRATLSPENAEALLRRARLLAASSHPCVERIREPIESEDTITLVSEFVDGEWLSALKDAKPRPSLEVLLRILLDTMRGLAAMLELTDAEGKPAPIVHGALSPEAVLVTPQGTTIVSRFARGVPRLAEVRADAAYVPFEVLRGRRPPDERSDVYSVGAMLWESLTGERPLANMSLSEIIETATETRVPPARVPSSAPWAEPLAEIAWRALALDAEERQRDVIAVAAEVRRIAGARVADPLAVEEFMKSVGAVVRVRERRTSLERGEEEEAPVSSSQLISESDIQVVRMPPIPSQRPKPTPPPLRMSSPPREPVEAAPPSPSPEPSSAKVPVASDPQPPELPSGERASLEEVMATPPKLPTAGAPVNDVALTDATPTSAPPKVIVELSSAEASEPPDPEREREAWERKQPTIRPQ